MTAFMYPWLLLLAVPVLLAALFAWKRKQPSVRVPSLNAAKASSGTRRRINWKRAVPFLCHTAAMLLLVIALARPREGLEQIRRRAEGIDIIIALALVAFVVFMGYTIMTSMGLL